MAERVICDSNIHDAVARETALKNLIERAQVAGHIVLLTTHVQLTELSEIPVANDIGQAEAINAERTGAAVFVLDYSRLDEDRLGTPEADAAFAAIQRGNCQHTEDAMIGVTALADADILVTNDIDFKKRFDALQSRVQVMSSSEFEDHLTHLLEGAT
jgi:predicted nucleic acid-binding protein